MLPLPLRQTLLLLVLALFSSSMPGQVLQATTRSTQQAGRGPVLVPLIYNSAQPPAYPDLRLTLQATPAAARPGEEASYSLTVENSGTSQAAGLSVNIDYESDQLTFVNSDLDTSRGDWLSSIEPTRLTLSFGALAPGAVRTGRVIVRVQSSAAPGTSIRVRAAYACSQGTCYTNNTTLTVIAGSAVLPQADSTPMLVVPDRGIAASEHRFVSDAFAPGELVDTWLNTPNGPQALALSARADALGQVRFNLNSADLVTGEYALVAYGKRSAVSAVGRFRVQGSASVLANSINHEDHEDYEGANRTSISSCPSCSSSSTRSLRDIPVLQQPSLGLRDGAAAQPRGGISGQVTAQESGAGLANVLVLVRDTTGQVVQSARTQADGRYFIFFGLASGSYTVQFRTANSANPTTAGYGGSKRTGVQVQAPAITSDIDATLTRAGGISGKLTALGSGTPLAGVPVLVTDSAGLPVASARSDAQGNYTLGGLASGSFNLRFVPALAGDPALAGYRTSNYAANPVVVVAGSVTPGADAQLARAANAGQIQGRVTTAEGGSGLAEVLVVVSQALSGRLVAISRSAADGRYSTPPLPDGNYTVYFLPGYSTIADTHAHLAASYPNNPVAVTSPQITSAVNAVLARGGQIGGLLSASPSGAAIDQALVIVYNSGGQVVGTTLTNQQGRYLTPGLPSGSYRLYFFTASSSVAATAAYASSYYSGKGTLASATPVVVTAPATRVNTNAVLTAGGQISGMVLASDDNQPLAGVTIIVTDAARHVRGLAISDADGQYSVKGLGSGSYLVWFDPILALNTLTASYIDTYYNQASTPSNATPVLVIAPYPANSINASLERGGQISGTVSASDTGKPLARVRVVAYTANGAARRVVLSDANGRYLLHGLPSGTYKLKFEPAASNDSVVQGYQAGFYNNRPATGNDQADLATADGVNVLSGQETGNIDAKLAP